MFNGMPNMTWLSWALAVLVLRQLGLRLTREHTSYWLIRHPWEEKAAIRAMPHSTLQWAKESAS